MRHIWTIFLITCLLLLSGCLGLFEDEENTQSNHIVYDEENKELIIVQTEDNVEQIKLIAEGKEYTYIPGKKSIISLEDLELEGSYELEIIPVYEDGDGEAINTINVKGQDEEQDNKVSKEGINIQQPEELSSRWMVVDKNNFNNYDTIQNAIDNAQPKQRIIVSEGEYNENLKIKKDIEIITVGEVILKGDGNGVGLEFSKNTGAIVDGFIIENYETGVVSKNSLNEWQLKNSIIRNNRYGAIIENSASNWVMSGVEIRDSEIRGLVVKQAYGSWTLEEARIYDNQIGLRLEDLMPRSSWKLRKVSIHSNDNGNITEVRVDSRGDGEEVWLPSEVAQSTKITIQNMCSVKDCDGELHEGFVENRFRNITHFNNEDPPRKLEVGKAEDYLFLRDAIEDHEQGDIIVVKKDVRPIDIKKDNLIIIGDVTMEKQPKIKPPEDRSAGKCVDLKDNAYGTQLINLHVTGCTEGIYANGNTNLYAKNLTIKENSNGMRFRQAKMDLYVEYSTILENSNVDILLSEFGKGDILFESSNIGNVVAGHSGEDVNFRWNTMYGNVESDDSTMVNVNHNYWTSDFGGEGFSKERISGYVIHGQVCKSPECYEFRNKAKFWE